jgi:hypothetical protein
MDSKSQSSPSSLHTASSQSTDSEWSSVYVEANESTNMRTLRVVCVTDIKRALRDHSVAEVMRRLFETEELLTAMKTDTVAERNVRHLGWIKPSLTAQSHGHTTITQAADQSWSHDHHQIPNPAHT